MLIWQSKIHSINLVVTFTIYFHEYTRYFLWKDVSQSIRYENRPCVPRPTRFFARRIEVKATQGRMSTLFLLCSVTFSDPAAQRNMVRTTCSCPFPIRWLTHREIMKKSEERKSFLLYRTNRKALLRVFLCVSLARVES